MLRPLAASLLLVTSAAWAADWPQWRGPGRDGLSPAATPKAWPHALTKAWSLEVGPGHAGPVVADGKVYLFVRQGEDEVVSAHELSTGKLLWKDAYPAAGYAPKQEAQAHGKGPFATPTLSGGVLYTFGVQSILSAWDAASGKLLWRNDYAKDYEVPHPYYGASLSPLAVDSSVIVYVGGPGKGSLLALDAKTGKPRWQLEGEGPPYASPVVATLGGVRQVVTMTQQSVLGVDLATGAKLWQVPFKVPYDQTIPTPVVLDDLVIVSGTDVDTQAIRVSKKDGAWATETAWSNRAIAMYMSSPVHADGVLYGYSTMKRGNVFAADPKTGQVRWQSDGRQGEHASVVAAGATLLLLTSGGELIAIARSPEGYRPIARYSIADSAVWAHPAVVDGGIVIKDAARLTLWRW